jgi:glucosamine--fructose-6-phosphate aminotransferase (isomerizing)
MRLETRAVHAGTTIDPATGVVTPPIQVAVTFERDADGGYPRGFLYGRNANPNRNELERCLADLEGGEAAAAFASGTGAIMAVVQALSPGDTKTPEAVRRPRASRRPRRGSGAGPGVESSSMRTGHPFHMHDAIYAQPGALRLVPRGNEQALAGAAERLRAMDHVLLSGVGTSWHAALVGELLLAHVGRLGYRARAIHAFDLAGSWPPAPARTGVVVVSHRGSARSPRAVLERAATGVGIAVTGKGTDGLDGAAFTLRTVEQEASRAHTVSYTTTLALLALLAAEVGRDDAFRHAVDGLPDHLALLLGQESWEDLAKRFAGRRRYWFVGGGPNIATALEGALKMSETSYATACGFNGEQFLHGPCAAMTSDDVLILVAPSGPSHARGVDVARVAREVGTPVLAIVEEGDRELAALAAETIELAAVPELLSPILAVVPLQLLSYHLALESEANPDTMRAHEPAHGRALEGFSP